MDCGGCIILSLNKSKEGKVFQASVRYANPGPSKFRFLLSRIWLRKRYRFSILFIIFTCSSALIVEYCLSNLMLHKIIVDKVSIARDRLLERPEFMVNKLIVNVDNQILRQKIVEVINVRLPVSSLMLSLEQIRTEIEKLSGVKEAQVSVERHGKLTISIKERRPAIINKVGSRYFLIDKDGYFINEVESRSDRLDLPLFIGNGVENKVKDGLKLLLDFGANNVRVNALSWVGNRRWDILFDEHRVIKLPSARPSESLERLKRLDLEFGVLSLDIPIIDLRSEEFFILLPNWKNLDKNSSNTKLLGEGV